MQKSQIIILIVIDSIIEFVFLIIQLMQTEEASYNPILSQLQLLKDKLSQKGKLIKILNECIQMQEKALFLIVSQFQQHESKIMRRLHKLQEINLRYIKDYLEVKSQNKVEDFIPIEHMFAVDAKTYISKKIESVKKVQNEDIKAITVQAESKKMVNNCLNIMKCYLTDRRIDYERQISRLSDQRKKKMKEAKGLEGYKQNKEEAKFIQELKKKVEKFNSKIVSVDDHNAIEFFNRRQEIQQDIARLDPSKGEITIEDSQKQQRMFNQMIEEIVTFDDKDEIEKYFMQGSFNFLQNKIEVLSEIYGAEYINQSIKSIKQLSMEEKNNLIENENYVKSMKSIKSVRFQDRTESQHLTNRQIQQRKMKGFSSIEFQQCSEGQEAIRRKRLNTENENQNDNSVSIDLEDNQQRESYQLTSRNRMGSKKAINSRLNNKFEETITKSFYKQQEKSRDQLISKQSKEIVEHQKVIDKLITFIKKQFKDRNLDDIDGDDPQKLIGYYFRVNEKKYVDIREQMQTLQKQTEKKVNSLTVQNEELSIKINEVKEEMEVLMKKYEKSSFQLHIMITNTEDLVKISLETLINTCMNTISPQELILQLEHIIQLIKQNMQNKRRTSYKFTVRSQKVENRQEKIENRQYLAFDHEVFSAITSHLDEIKSQFEEKEKRDYQEVVDEKPREKRKISEQHQSQESEQNEEIKKEESEIKHAEQQLLLRIQSNKDKSQDKEVTKCQGFDQKFIHSIQQKIQKIKDKTFNQNDQLDDMNQMYAKYKQALDCLERAQNVNRQNEIKYQKFLSGLKRMRAWECPEKLQEKLFYMEKLIAQQNQLLQNQRAEYEQTILKQIEQSERLAQNIIKNIRPTRNGSKK